MFSNEYKLVDRECLLISNCFAIGLTSLRKANIDNKGLFYNSFFQLSIGIERLCKLALGISNYSLNGKFLTMREMKDLGHGINDLLEKVHGKISNDLEPISKSIASKEIVSLLTDFAKNTRYYNLDLLSGAVNLGKEPISEWYNKVIPNMLKHIMQTNAKLYRSINKKIQQHVAVNKIFEDILNVLYFDVDGNSSEWYVRNSKIIYEVTPYLIIEIANIVKPIIEYIQEIVSKSKLELPSIQEYFYYNVLLDDQFLRTRKIFKVFYND